MGDRDADYAILDLDPVTGKFEVSLENVPTNILCSTNRLCSVSSRGPDAGPTVSQGRDNLSNQIPRTRQLGQLKEQAGFLVSKSLALPCALP